MKNALLELLLVAAAVFATDLHAQRRSTNGLVALNNYDSGMGIYLAPYPTPAPGGTYYEILGGPSATSLAPLLNAAGEGPIFRIQADEVNAIGPGNGSFFDQGYVGVPGVPEDGIGFFQLRAWMNAATYQTAQVQETSPIWSQLTGRDGYVMGPPVPLPLYIPAPIIMVPIPEPSALALVALGLVALAILHRKPFVVPERV